MQTERKHTETFPRTEGGEIAQEFEDARKPYIQSALKAKMPNLREKRKTDKEKGKIRPSTKASRNMTEARESQDFKKWAAAHDPEPDRHDTELRTWLYEEALPSDKPVPYTMTYKPKTNQFGGIEKHKARYVPDEAIS